MISTRFCPVCGAANEETQAHCFACGQLLPVGIEQDTTPGGTLLHERYRLGPTLGSGGYSAVYRGWDTRAGDRVVAVKPSLMPSSGHPTASILSPREIMETPSCYLLIIHK